MPIKVYFLKTCKKLSKPERSFSKTSGHSVSKIYNNNNNFFLKTTTFHPKFGSVWKVKIINDNG